MQKPILFASAALLAAAAASPAFAQGYGPGQRGERRIDALFAKVDVNKDGKITKEEIVAYRTAQFEAADKNKDGYLEGDEIRTFLINRRLAMRDADGDGKISAKEFGERRAERFKALDTNKDGSLTADELMAARDKRMKRLTKPGERRAKRRGHRGKRFARMWMYRMDLNKDGRISLAEYNLRGDRMFLAFDLNSDGSITKIEMRQRFAMGFGPRWRKGRHHGMRHYRKAKYGQMRGYGPRGHGPRGQGPRRPGGQPN